MTAGHPAPHRALAGLYDAAGRTGDAIAACRSAVAADEPRAWSRLADLLKDADRADDAEAVADDTDARAIGVGDLDGDLAAREAVALGEVEELDVEEP